MSRSMTLVKPPTQAERLAALEKRADAFERMAAPLAEICEAWQRFQTINWFVVKIGAWVGGSFGAVAVILTIVEKSKALLGH